MTLKSELESLLLSQLALRRIDGSPVYASIANVEAAYPHLNTLNTKLSRIIEAGSDMPLLELVEIMQSAQEIVDQAIRDVLPADKKAAYDQLRKER